MIVHSVRPMNPSPLPLENISPLDGNRPANIHRRDVLLLVLLLHRCDPTERLLGRVDKLWRQRQEILSMSNDETKMFTFPIRHGLIFSVTSTPIDTESLHISVHLRRVCRLLLRRHRAENCAQSPFRSPVVYCPMVSHRLRRHLLSWSDNEWSLVFASETCVVKSLLREESETRQESNGENQQRHWAFLTAAAGTRRLPSVDLFWSTRNIL